MIRVATICALSDLALMVVYLPIERCLCVLKISAGGRAFGNCSSVQLEPSYPLHCLIRTLEFVRQGLEREAQVARLPVLLSPHRVERSAGQLHVGCIYQSMQGYRWGGKEWKAIKKTALHEHFSTLICQLFPSQHSLLSFQSLLFLSNIVHHISRFKH